MVKLCPLRAAQSPVSPPKATASPSAKVRVDATVTRAGFAVEILTTFSLAMPLFTPSCRIPKCQSGCSGSRFAAIVAVRWAVGHAPETTAILLSYTLRFRCLPPTVTLTVRPGVPAKLWCRKGPSKRLGVAEISKKASPVTFSTMAAHVGLHTHTPNFPEVPAVMSYPNITSFNPSPRGDGVVAVNPAAASRVQSTRPSCAFTTLTVHFSESS
mmetsp:Transcript_20020/g.44436  ORF Transcript_20020/g.44436 Transcript_20020/m.44436 type:complete len:213 (+) Transcript_20020:1709-2347(+)